MPELTVLSFRDADSETVVELALAPENAQALVDQIAKRLAAIRESGLRSVDTA
jgi:hypothetical protein